MKNKNYTKHIFSILFGMCLFLSFENKPVAFNAHTHRYVTTSGLEIISQINRKKSKKERIFNKKDESYWDLVADYSLKPDEDEIDGAYKYHFYNFVTERNFMNEKETALKRLTDHFEKAVSEYKLNNKETAYQELGRALHFLEDLNTPVHTVYQLACDAVLKFPLHVRFEKKCDEICDSCKADIVPESLKYYEVNSLEDIAKASSVLSENNFCGLEDNFSKLSEKVAKNAVLNAQNRVTGVLYKFFKQVNS